MSAVSLRGVSKTFGTGDRAVTALADVDLEVAAGEFVCLIGASGVVRATTSPCERPGPATTARYTTQ